MPTERALAIAQPVCEALKYAHARNVVHRDIKPANIMLTGEGRVKVTDFGLAGIIRSGARSNSDPPSSHTRMGTPGYMSPEQMQNSDSVDGRSDIYSLGVVLYELASGVRPALASYVPASEVCERADPRLDPIIQKCLHLDREERYESAEQLLADIVRLRRELEKAPSCPVCAHVSPVRFEKCENCSEELSEFFDPCPRCGGKNRCDVQNCLHCSVELEVTRASAQAQIDRKLQEADELRLAQKFEEAWQILTEILEVKGRAFQPTRNQSSALLRKIEVEQREVAKWKLAHGKRLFHAGDAAGAIAVWESTNPQTEEIRAAVESARLQIKELEAVRRANTKMTILLVMLAFFILLAMLIFGLTR